MFRRIVFAGAFALLCLSPISAQRRGGGAASAEALSFRFLGPVVGNRVASIAGVPGDPSIYYAGAASGGVWKTTDGGIRWAPVSDACRSPRSARSRWRRRIPNVVWAGTGEAWAIRDSDVIGDGIYKSIDAGKTWTHIGSRRDRPHRPHPHPPDESRHRLRLRDRPHHRAAAGARRLPHDRRRTALGARAVRRREHRLLRACRWTRRIRARSSPARGRSRCIRGRCSAAGRAAASTCRATAAGRGRRSRPPGLPQVAARQDRRRRRADRFESRLRADPDRRIRDRSGDRTTAARSWRVVNWSRALIGRAGYYIHLAVSPGNEDEVLVSNSSFLQSIDGGQTFRSVNWGGDNHDIWWDPKDAGSLRDHARRRHDASRRSTAAARSACSCRSARCITSPSTTRCRTTSTRNMQDDGTMRGSVIAAENAGAGYNGSGNTLGPRPRRLRVGLHRPRSGGSEHRLVDVLRQQGDALRPPDEGRALGRAVA